MPYQDYLEFTELLFSKNPHYKQHSATGGDLNIVKNTLNKKVVSSTDFFLDFNGIRACKKNGDSFIFKYGEGLYGVWNSISNTFDFSQNFDLPDEDWSKEK
jgi:hypothetical protein